MHLPSTINRSYASKLRKAYKHYCVPFARRLVRVVEDAYLRVGMYRECFEYPHGEVCTSTERETPVRHEIVGMESGDASSVVESRGSSRLRPAAEDALPEASQAAVRARMNADALEDGELTHKLFAPFRRPSAKQLDIRNHILREWYRDVSVRLTVYRALHQIPAVYHELGVAVFTYLEIHGKINFGALDFARPLATHLSGLERNFNKSGVAIVGAGIAGLTAARHLQSYGIGVTIYEARARLGGRAFTDVDTFSAPVDLGAMIITGIIQNPVAVVAAQVGADLMALKTECPLMDVDGTWVPLDLDEWAEKEFNYLLDATAMYRQTYSSDPIAQNMSLGKTFQLALKQRSRRPEAWQVLPENNSGDSSCFRSIPKINSRSALRIGPQKLEKSGLRLSIPCGEQSADLLGRLLRWHIANLEYACAADVHAVSLMNWDQDDPYGFSGEDAVVRPGFRKLVDGLASGLSSKVKLGSCVEKIRRQKPSSRGPASVYIQFQQGCLVRTEQYDAAVITVPLGVLKAESIKFEPRLPLSKRTAIQQLGNGGLVKVAIEFSEAFWDEESMFGVLNERVELRGRYYFFYNLDYYIGKPVLMTLVTEPSVLITEHLTDADVLRGVMEVLRRRYGNAPDPIAHAVTKWSRDPYSRGAYSYIPIGCSGDEYDQLAGSVDQCLYFAGEHTCRRHPTTTASAFLSGYRAGCSIIEDMGIVDDISSFYAMTLRSCIDAGGLDLDLPSAGDGECAGTEVSPASLSCHRADLSAGGRAAGGMPKCIPTSTMQLRSRRRAEDQHS
jgi:monoamine oxidase